MQTTDVLKKALVVSLIAMAVSSLGLADDVTIELVQAPDAPTIGILADDGIYNPQGQYSQVAAAPGGFTQTPG
ncbi:MAG: hypothetical protein LBQ83_08125 [Candidatus Margulisbacteria bacterium]|jgi:hypothetical protein|nr:hypothetical protein [Candidatus Margulisiibacteriota bacterium]